MKKFATSSLSSDALHTSVTRIYEIIIINILADPFITKVAPLLKKWITELSKTLGRTTSPEQVRMLRQKDGKRDSLYISLRDFVKSCSNDLDASIATAANSLLNIFHELGWTLYSLGDADESSKLKTLIEKLEAEPFKSAVTAISATTKFINLKAAQDDFEKTLNDKVDANVAKEYLRMKECRQNIYRYVAALLSHMDMMDETDGGAYHTATIKIDEVITETIALAKANQTRKESKDKGDTTGTGK